MPWNPEIIFKQEDINTGVPKHEQEEIERQGIVSFFNDDKGYGFIKDLTSQESVFVHANQLSEPVKENTRVSFQVERTARGLSALNVKKSI